LAAKKGYIQIIKFLYENREEGCSLNAIDNAASYGHIVSVRYFLENKIQNFTEKALIESKRKDFIAVHRLLLQYKDRMIIET
jgi:hypothetical protein